MSSNSPSDKRSAVAEQNGAGSGTLTLMPATNEYLFRKSWLQAFQAGRACANDGVIAVSPTDCESQYASSPRHITGSVCKMIFKSTSSDQFSI